MVVEICFRGLLLRFMNQHWLAVKGQITSVIMNRKWSIPWPAVAAVEAAAAVPVLDSGSGLFLVDRSMGELVLGASLRVSVGWSEVCSSGVDVLPAASVLLDDGPEVGFSAWFNWAS